MLAYGQLLEGRERSQARAREGLRLEVRALLRQALSALVPGHRVLVFGSLSCTGQFRESSDVDIALESVPDEWSPYALASEIGERLGRSVDLVLLPECRFQEKLRREGEWWTT